MDTAKAANLYMSDRQVCSLSQNPLKTRGPTPLPICESLQVSETRQLLEGTEENKLYFPERGP